MQNDFRQINLEDNGSGQRKRRKKGLKRYWPLFILASLIIVGTFVWSFLFSTSSVFTYAFPKVFQNPIKNTDDRVNILLLGNAGGTHDGPNLTDSIIVASYHLKQEEAILFSIPRDLWIDSAKAKVNAIYEYGKKKDKGLESAKEEISDLMGIPIHYGVRLDFAGFERAIDLVEGIEIEVPKTFDDYVYPITGKEEDLCDNVEKEIELEEAVGKEFKLQSVGESEKEGFLKYKALVDPKGDVATTSAQFACRYEHIRFEKGVTQMDGKTALKFVRSRMGTNGEGSDFARSRRQQLVLQGFRNRALSLETLFNPQRIGGLFDTFGKSVETDIPKERSLDFYNLVRKMKKTESVVLGDLGEGKSLFVNPPPSEYGGGWVLIPPNNDINLIREFVKDKLKEKKEVIKE